MKTIINVGLPRTGTQSFDTYMEQAYMFKTAHILPNDPVNKFKFINNELNAISYAIDTYDCLGDCPLNLPFIILKLSTLKDCQLVRTTRDFESWHQSMKPSENNWQWLLKEYNTVDFYEVFIKHKNLCDHLNIPFIDLRQDKKQCITDIVGESIHNIEYPIVDGAKKQKNIVPPVFIKDDSHIIWKSFCKKYNLS